MRKDINGPISAPKVKTKKQKEILEGLRYFLGKIEKEGIRIDMHEPETRNVSITSDYRPPIVEHAEQDPLIGKELVQALEKFLQPEDRGIVLAKFNSGDFYLALSIMGNDKYTVTLNGEIIFSSDDYEEAMGMFYSKVKMVSEAQEVGKDCDFVIFEERLHALNRQVSPMVWDLFRKTKMLKADPPAHYFGVVPFNEEAGETVKVDHEKRKEDKVKIPFEAHKTVTSLSSSDMGGEYVSAQPTPHNTFFNNQDSFSIPKFSTGEDENIVSLTSDYPEQTESDFGFNSNSGARELSHSVLSPDYNPTRTVTDNIIKQTQGELANIAEDVQRELDTIKVYKQHLNNSQTPEIISVLEHVIKEEQEHVEEFNSLLTNRNLPYMINNEFGVVGDLNVPTYGNGEEDDSKTIDFYKAISIMPPNQALNQLCQLVDGFDFLQKEDGKPFIIAGYASVNIVDKESQRITIPALKAAVPRFMKRPEYANLNVFHSNVQVGRIIPEWEDLITNKKYFTHVDDIGWYVVAELRDDIEVAKKVRDEIDRGVLRSFSISGTATKKKLTCEGGKCYTEILELEIYEVTICEEGINGESKFELINKSLSYCNSCPNSAKNCHLLELGRREEEDNILDQVDDYLREVDQVNKIVDILKQIGRKPVTNPKAPPTYSYGAGRLIPKVVPIKRAGKVYMAVRYLRPEDLSEGQEKVRANNRHDASAAYRGKGAGNDAIHRGALNLTNNYRGLLSYYEGLEGKWKKRWDKNKELALEIVDNSPLSYNTNIDNLIKVLGSTKDFSPTIISSLEKGLGLENMLSTFFGRVPIQYGLITVLLNREKLEQKGTIGCRFEPAAWLNPKLISAEGLDGPNVLENIKKQLNNITTNMVSGEEVKELLARHIALEYEDPNVFIRNFDFSDTNNLAWYGWNIWISTPISVDDIEFIIVPNEYCRDKISEAGFEKDQILSLEKMETSNNIPINYTRVSFKIMKEELTDD